MNDLAQYDYQTMPIHSALIDILVLLAAVLNVMLSKDANMFVITMFNRCSLLVSLCAEYGTLLQL